MYYSMPGQLEAVGVYTPNTQFVLSSKKLRELGFTQQEINTLEYVNACGLKATPMELQRLGMNYEYAKRIKYMQDLATGKISIESKYDFIKHLKKLFGQHKKIGIQDLAVSKVHEVPRWAVVANIKDPVYSAVNSNNYHGTEMLYPVTEVTSRVTIAYPRKLVIKYGYPKKIPNVIEVQDKKQPNGLPILSINKDFCRVCNRYIIVASLKRPEFHHGMMEIICIEGTLVYVYAQNMGTKANVSYQGGTTRVYDYGYMVNEIIPRITKVAETIYKNVCGVYAEYVPATSDFKLLDVEPLDDSMELED